MLGQKVQQRPTSWANSLNLSQPNPAVRPPDYPLVPNCIKTSVMTDSLFCQLVKQLRLYYLEEGSGMQRKRGVYSSENSQFPMKGSSNISYSSLAHALPVHFETDSTVIVDGRRKLLEE